jgi:hypothetical protein
MKTDLSFVLVALLDLLPNLNTRTIDGSPETASSTNSVLFNFNLSTHFETAVSAIDSQMLKRVWQELDYRSDICRVTKGGHIEHL